MSEVRSGRVGGDRRYSEDANYAGAVDISLVWWRHSGVTGSRFSHQAPMGTGGDVDNPIERYTRSLRAGCFLSPLRAEPRIVLLSPASFSWMLSVAVAVDEKVHSVKPIDEGP